MLNEGQAVGGRKILTGSCQSKGLDRTEDPRCTTYSLSEGGRGGGDSSVRCRCRALSSALPTLEYSTYRYLYYHTGDGQIDWDLGRRVDDGAGAVPPVGRLHCPGWGWLCFMICTCLPRRKRRRGEEGPDIGVEERVRGRKGGEWMVVICYCTFPS